MPLFMHGCMKSMAIKQHLFWERPCFAWPRIFAARAHTSPFFEEPSTSVSGHRGRTGAALDLQATLVGSSDEHLVLMSTMSVRPLTALGHNVTRRCLLSACRLEDDVGKLVLCSKDHPIFLILNRCVFNVFLRERGCGSREGKAGMVRKKSVWEVQTRHCSVADVTGYRLVLCLLQCDVTPGSTRGCCVEVQLCHFVKVLVLTN